MLYKKIYIYVNVRIVTISLLCLTTGVVHQIFTQFREIDRLSLYISFFLSLSLSYSPYLSLFLPCINLFLPYITSFFLHTYLEESHSPHPLGCGLCVYMTKGGWASNEIAGNFDKVPLARQIFEETTFLGWIKTRFPRNSIFWNKKRIIFTKYWLK